MWIENYKKAEDFLGKVIAIYEQVIQAYGENPLSDPYFDPEILTDINNGKELLSILQNKASNWEKLLEERISFLEKDTLEQVWGIAVDEEGRTIKAK